MLVRILSVFAFTCLAGATVLAADNSMAGKWKLNPQKSTLTGLQEKIENVGGDKYKFVFGDEVENVAFDGKEYPTTDGFMWSVTKTGPNSWKSIHKKDGKVTSTANWVLSDNGKMFTSTLNGTRADGSSYTQTFKARRVGSGSGMAGTWRSTEMSMGSSSAMVIKENGSDGLTLAWPADKERIEMKLDGKAYPDKGPRVGEGTTVSGKRINMDTVELTGRMKDKLLYTERVQLSKDGKTLTATMHFPGVKKAEVDVYDRI